jgi:uncharacterized protein with GYD domain
MAKYVVLGNWTEQGIKNATGAVDRAHQAADALAAIGGKMHSTHWTLGTYDFVSIVEAPDDESLVAVLLKLAGAGNVRTTTMRAFDESEVSGIFAKVS